MPKIVKGRVVSDNTRVTPMKEKFVEGLEAGMIPSQAAAYAGSRDPQQYASTMLAVDPWIMEQAARIKAEAQERTKVTRDKVTAIVLDAVGMAQQLSLPGDMIRGAAELNRMNGFYAPDKLDINIEAKVRRIQTQFERLTDAELIEMMGERLDPIEAEFRRLEGPAISDQDAANHA